MMGLIRRRRKGRPDEDKFDLLTTAFNLPNRHTLERDERRRVLKDQNQHYVIIARHAQGEDSDDSDDSSETQSETVVESNMDTESDQSSSEEEDEEIVCMKKLKTPLRKTKPASPPLQPAKASKWSHRRLRSEPQKTCLKLVEAEAARVPATEPRPSRHEKRREKKLRAKELGKASRKSTSSEGSPATSSMVNTSHTAHGSAPTFVRGPLPAAQPSFVQPSMHPPVPQMYYPAQTSHNYGVHMGSAPHPHLDVWGLAQQHHFADSQHFTRPQSWHMSGAGVTPQTTTKAQEVQRIQQDLDEVTAAINLSPSDMSLHARAAALRNLLNCTLNEAMGQHTQLENRPSVDNNFVSGQVISDAHPSKTENKENIKDIATHHCCDECGSLRSRKYHEMHPLAPGKLKHPNLCEDCREAHHKSGVMGDQSQHICFGCGIFRSSTFNKQNPLPPGKPLVVNFCGRCKRETQVENDFGSSVDILHSKSVSRKATPGKLGQHAPAKTKSSKTRSKESASGVSKLPATLTQQSPANVDPEMVSPLSPASAARNERRAKRRNQASTAEHEAVSPPETPLDPPKQYQAPFVEDVTTPVMTKAAGASSQLSSILRPRKGSGSSADSSNVSSLSDDSGKSSTNKSVKFKEFVGVRRSRSPASSGLSSEAKVEEAIKPDDDSTPKRRGDFGESPRRDNYGRPMFSTEYFARKMGVEIDDTVPSPPPTTGYNKGAFASMASDGLDAGATGYSPRWRERSRHSGRGPWYSTPPGSHTAPYDDYGGQPTYDAGLDGTKDEFTPTQHHPRRRSVFASFFDDVPEGYQGPTPSSPFRPATSSSSNTHQYWRDDGFRSNKGAFSQDHSWDAGRPSTAGQDSYYSNNYATASTPRTYPTFHFTTSYSDHSWSEKYSGKQTSNEDKTNFGNMYIPEPIIEEPDSPPSSPIASPRLLELEVIPISDDGTSQEPQTPETSDDGSSEVDSTKHSGVPSSPIAQSDIAW